MTKNLDQLRACLRDYVETITIKSKGADKYNCPLCNSGTGKGEKRSMTGAFSIDKRDTTKWHCFACGHGGDIFELYGQLNNTTNFKEQLDAINAMYGNGNAPRITKPRHDQSAEREEADYTQFILKAEKAIDDTDYWQRRGLTRATVERFHLGFDPNWTNPKATAAPPSPRLIIPTSKHSYLARDTRPELTDIQRKYNKIKVGKVRIFNSRALKEAQKPICIVEGEINALSIIDVGGEAVALGSASNVRLLMEMLKTEPPRQPLIIVRDNDDTGRRAEEEMENGLRELGIPFYKSNLAAGFNDVNDALIADRAAFTRAVEQAEQAQAEQETAATEDEREKYKKTSTAHYLQSFINGIADSVNTPYQPTGFSKLDGVLDGGLYEGLYIIGAISSLGKTTFVTQMADQMAQAGKDILIFSLEMARSELMAKSISRHTIQIELSAGHGASNAKTARGITTGRRYAIYSHEEKELINKAILAYSEYAGNIYISEGVGDIGTAQISEQVEKHILLTGETPIVIVDYLQILAPYNIRATDKQNTDRAVMELKRISRDYKTPVIGISSFNRASYKEAVTMEAFKESGAIEYSSDVLFGLQLKGAGKSDFDTTKAKKENPREIELLVLKNRSGRTGDTLNYKYYPMFNYFIEA